MTRLVFAFMTLALASGCSEEPELFRMTLIASNVDESEAFLGEAVGPPNDQGAFRMVSRSGVFCEGFYLMSSPENGEAIARCSDGRTGEFEIGSTGLSAQITGRIGGEHFSGGAIDRRIVDAALSRLANG